MPVAAGRTRGRGPNAQERLWRGRDGREGARPSHRSDHAEIHAGCMHSRLFHHEDQTPEVWLPHSSVLSRSRNTKHFSEFQVHFYCDVTKDPKNLYLYYVCVVQYRVSLRAHHDGFRRNLPIQNSIWLWLWLWLCGFGFGFGFLQWRWPKRRRR